MFNTRESLDLNRDLAVGRQRSYHFASHAAVTSCLVFSSACFINRCLFAASKAKQIQTFSRHFVYFLDFLHTFEKRFKGFPIFQTLYEPWSHFTITNFFITALPISRPRRGWRSGSNHKVPGSNSGPAEC